MMNLKQVFGIVIMMMGVLSIGHSQIIMTCHHNDVVQRKIDYLGDDKTEMFSGIIMKSNGREKKIYAPYKVRVRSNRYIQVTDAYNNKVNIDVNRVVLYNKKELLLDFLTGCSLESSGGGPGVESSDQTVGTGGNTGQNVGINTTGPQYTLDINASDAMRVPVGTTLERPSNLQAGIIRFNTTTGKFEGYNGSSWVEF